jgi:membrane fusion protein
MKLFREESLATQQQKHLGSIVLRSPFVFWLLTAAILLFMVLIIGLFNWGEYTRRATLPGYVIPVAGVVRVYSPSGGQVAIVSVAEGQHVAAGEKLLTVLDERQIEARQGNLRTVQSQQRALYAQTRAGLQVRIAALQQEHEQIIKEQATVQRRLGFAQSTESRFRELHAKGFVSDNEAQEKTEAVTEVQARLQTLERGQTAIGREISTLTSELSILPMREHTQISELDRSFRTAEQELIEAKSRLEVLITAPQAGIVSGLTAKPGYAVIPERPLLTLVPAAGAGSALEVHLFALSKDAGFVRPGQEVFIRYQAFPYQKFGHYKGKVVEVSNTPLSPSELMYPVSAKLESSSLIPAIPNLPPTDPTYRIRIAIAQQTATAYGQAQPLQPGMQLDADVMLDTRTLIEWVFEPLYSLHGKYFR